MTDPAFHADAASALDWWRLAGVDQLYGEAKGWLREPAPAGQADHGEPQAPKSAAPAPTPPKPTAPPAPVPQMGGAAEGWPADLAAFRDWWLAEPTLAPGGAAERVASRGDAAAALLVLVPQPEAEDTAAGQLLAGEQGRLISAMLRAMGIGEDQAARVALLPRHTPFADWDALAAAGLGPLARHHLALHAPMRVLVLGQGILPLLGLDPAQKTAHLPLAGREEPGVPLLAAPAAEVLLARPAARAALWRAWLEWTQEG
jgi:DNA polymerase